MNPNPTKARQSKRAKRITAGTIEDARFMLWRALERAEELLDATDESGNPDNVLALKAIHAISQSAAAYARIVELGEIEARLQAVEQRQARFTSELGKGAA